MLDQMRKGAGNWAAKILLGLLVISFGAWGIGDYIRGSNAVPPVAKVGGKEITAAEFSDALRKDAANLSRRMGMQMSREQLLALGLDESVLNRLVETKLYEVEAERLGIRPGVEQVRAAILSAPAFRGTNGQFDRLRYESYLRNDGLTENMFIELVRQDVIRAELLGSVLSGFDTAPKVAVDALLAYRLESRVAEFIRVEAAKLPAPPAPTEAEIEQYYKDNPAAYTQPERRVLSWVSFTPANQAAGFAATDAEIAEEYDAHRDAYGTPEKRHVQQVVFGSEEEARAAYEAVKKGEDFAAMAQRTKQMKAADIELGVLAKNELPAELAAPVFALAAPGPVEPVKSAFGWHLARVESITPGTQKSLNDVKAELAQIVAQRKAGEALPKLRNRIDDLIAGGANVAEIAKQQNGEVKTSALLDAQGRDAEGKPVAGLPPVPTLLTDVFQHLQAGSEPLLIDDSEGGFHAIAVTEVKPEALQPLADVKAQVIEAVTRRARAKAAEERANQIATRLSGGGEFLKEAQALGVLAASTPPLLRSGQPAERNFTPALVTKLFAATPAAPVISGPASTAGDQIVARLVKITPADTAAIANEYERTQQQITQAMVSDLAEQYRKTLETAIGVRVDNAARARARAL